MIRAYSNDDFEASIDVERSTIVIPMAFKLGIKVANRAPGNIVKPKFDYQPERFKLPYGLIIASYGDVVYVAWGDDPFDMVPKETSNLTLHAGRRIR